MVVVVVVEVVVVVVVVVVVAVIAVKKQLSFRLVSSNCINNPLNPIPTGLGHLTLIYGLIPPMAGRNRINFIFDHHICILVKRNCRISYL